MNDKILILAAGNSSRLGENKQFLTKNGSTLLNRCINVCQETSLGTISIVIGFEAEAIKEMISDNNTSIIHNQNWRNGMGTSIVVGIDSFDEQVSGVYIVLPDQINLNPTILNKIMKAKENNPSSIITCKYGDNFGAPTFFPAIYFDALRKCVGQNGAKQVIQENMEAVRFIEFDGGEIDIDITDDLQHLD